MKNRIEQNVLPYIETYFSVIHLAIFLLRLSYYFLTT